VGRKQDWHVTTANRDTAGLAGDLSRRPQDNFELNLSTRARFVLTSTSQITVPFGTVRRSARGQVAGARKCTRAEVCRMEQS
jgi:hypothetical protein